jgi:hypothetical protein
MYDKTSGKLLGYEVLETVDLPVVGTINLDTLWFNLSDVSGINQIRYDSSAKKFYVNNSSKAWEPVKVGTFEDPLRMNSRKFDIEFRTQYFYYYDAVSGDYVKVSAEVPMLFVQEKDFATIEDTISDKNNVNLDITASATDLQVLMSSYDIMVPTFIEIKDLVTEELIIAYIGEKLVFTEEE